MAQLHLQHYSKTRFKNLIRLAKHIHNKQEAVVRISPQATGRISIGRLSSPPPKQPRNITEEHQKRIEELESKRKKRQEIAEKQLKESIKDKKERAQKFIEK